MAVPERGGYSFRFALAAGKAREEAHLFLSRIYVDQGFWEKRDSYSEKLFHHRLPETACVTAYREGVLSGTISVFRDGDAGLPSNGLFSGEMAALRSAGRSFVEIGALGIRGTQPYILHHLYKIALNYSLFHLQADDLLLTVHPRHKTFYKALFCMEELGGARPHPSVNGSPAVLLRMNLHTFAGEMEKSFPRDPREKDMHRFYLLERPADIPGEIYRPARNEEGEYV